MKDFEKQFCRHTLDRLSHATRSRLENLVADDGRDEGAGGDGAAAGGGRSHFAELKMDPGAQGVESLLAEVNKLERVRRLELPADLFADVSEKLVAVWRARASWCCRCRRWRTTSRSGRRRHGERTSHGWPPAVARTVSRVERGLGGATTPRPSA
ncbi:hypothetical protein [Streptomyces umbrinus]|uniref:hypothetical protein n=1 Tax=Streptomyces umbrinus TaxID=67370 RepID=UPI0033F6E9D6